MLKPRRASLRLSLLGLACLASLTSASATVYYVSPSGSDAYPGTPAAPWRTIQKAAARMVAGDKTLIADGEYPGGITQTRSGTPNAWISFCAVNKGGPVIRGDLTTNRDAFYVTGADYVVLYGLTIRKARRAGLRISHSNHVEAWECRFIENGTWGVFTDFSNDTRLEGNECAWSAGQHGIYISNSSDRPVIRWNRLHHNTRAGVQINADPAFLEPSLGTRGDGITHGAIVAYNVIWENGRGGAAAINLASVRNSLIANNLLAHNLAGGIALWDDGAGSKWGCKSNLILSNTVYFRNGEGRWCLSLKNGSTGCIVANNILRGGRSGAIEIDKTSPLYSDRNLLQGANGGTRVATNEDTGKLYTLAQWQAATGNDRNSLNADPLFVSPEHEPLSFRLRPGSPAIDAGMVLGEVNRDFNGVPRPIGPRHDIGCYEALTPAR